MEESEHLNNVWYLSKEQLAVEVIGVNIVCGLIGYFVTTRIAKLSPALFPSRHPFTLPHNRVSGGVAAGRRAKKRSAPSRSSVVYLCLCAALLASFCMVIYDKLQFDLIYLVNLACPCHIIIIAFFAAVYLREEYPKSGYPIACLLYNFVLSSSHYSIIAMVVAMSNPKAFVAEDIGMAHGAEDDSDLDHGPGRINFSKILLFYGHHALLLVVPLLGLYFKYFTVLDWEGKWTEHTGGEIGKKGKNKATWWDAFVRKYAVLLVSISYGVPLFFDVQLPLALWSHQNVNFMAAPPPVPFLQGKYYHFKVMPLLLIAQYVVNRLITLTATW
eukprot:CAMPEP_0119122108 /NCGR_PEP_ID=MMETSP1310-20130426/2464_1 /TAXON_ID=464262 /ORGANISM="Genus nov. species nov., Strain RCC2339" /LENGTH=328 /DNA_ID=CAMNT_0007111719 /DNA_START=80 /DNA_END=1063 /DNA_ORIENTATION=+